MTAERPHQATFAVTLNYDVRDKLRRGTETITNLVGGSFTVLTLSPEIGYRLPRGFSARLRAPFHWKTFDETSPTVHAKRTGLGDVELLGSYDIFYADEPAAPPPAPPAPWRLTLSAGAALPTGQHEAQPFVGDVAPTPLQLGGGTLDPLFSASGQVRPHRYFAIDANAGARLSVMENMHSYRPASLFEVGVGGGWRPWPDRLGLDAHVEWSHVTHVAVAGIDVPNTGRDTIYVVPGVNVRIWRELSAGLSARVPVYLRVQQTQFAENALFLARVVYRTPPLF